MQVKFSARVSGIERILDQLPARVVGKIMRVNQENAKMFVKTFQDGIRTESFRLKPLKLSTIARKASRGLPQPETPLYGLGDESKDRSYINMFRIQEVRDGYLASPSRAKHWSGNIQLRVLYMIHEFGATIKRGKTLIRIPPRPAVQKAYNRFHRSEFYKDSKAKIIKIIKGMLRK